MVCESVKVGVECLFMNKNGCQFNGGSCHPVVEQCGDCQKIQELPAGKYCLSFPDPAIKWRLGACGMATHIKASSPKHGLKLNPLKASKRKTR